jgi:L,D-transpeptidase catalytic domain
MTMASRSVALFVLLVVGVVIPAAATEAAAGRVQVAFLRGEQVATVPRPGATPTDAVRALLARPPDRAPDPEQPCRARDLGLDRKALDPDAAGCLPRLREDPRWWSTPFREWLLWAIPFVGGIAFHQYEVVPTYAASHGCVRQQSTVARWTYDFAYVGMPVKVIASS